MLAKKEPTSGPHVKAALKDVPLSERIQATLVRQIIIVGLIAAVYFVWQQSDGAWAAVSAIYGGAVACMMSLLLAAEVMWLSKNLRRKNRLYNAFMFFSFAPRLVIVIVAFWFGVGLLKVMPAPMIVAFSATYIAFLLDFRGKKKSAPKQNDRI